MKGVLSGGEVVDVVFELLVPGVAVQKLGRRGIAIADVQQLPWNENVTTHDPGTDVKGRRLLIGRTDGGQVLTLVIERTLDPTTWLVITGWTATGSERRMIDYD